MLETPETKTVTDADAARLDAIHAEVSALLTEAATIARRAIPDNKTSVYVTCQGVTYSHRSEPVPRAEITAVLVDRMDGKGGGACGANVDKEYPKLSAALASVAAQVAEARHE